MSDLMDFSDFNWPFYIAIYATCAAVIYFSGFTTMYKIVLLVLFIPILYVVLKIKLD